MSYFNYARGLMPFFLLFLFLPSFAVYGETAPLLEEANYFYEKGGLAITFEERKRFFNQALLLYHLAEEKTASSDLYRGLGDIYFQLGESPWAILFYERALKKDPHSFLALAHLKKAQQQLGLSLSCPSFSILSFLHSLSFFVGFLFILFILYSGVIWFRFALLRQIAKMSTISVAFICFYLLVNDFSRPLEGILVEPTHLHRFPNRHPPQVTLQPLMPGSKVNVLQILNEGSWLKIRHQESETGYVPAESIRLI